jgi:hypothetical protein
MNSVLAGIHRAFYYSNLKKSEFDDYIELFFKISRTAIFNVALEAMRVIYILTTFTDDQILISRYYTLLYDKVNN